MKKNIRYPREKPSLLKILVIAGSLAAATFGAGYHSGIKERLYNQIKIQDAQLTKRTDESLEPIFREYFQKKEFSKDVNPWHYASKIAKQPGMQKLMRESGWDNQTLAGALRRYMERNK